MATAVEIFKAAVDLGCSDIHLKPGANPKARINGNLVKLKQFPILTPDDTKALIYETMSSKNMAAFNQDGIYELDYSFDLPLIGRFRMNVFKTRNAMGLVARLLHDAPQSLDELGTPPILKTLAMMKTGIVIVSGATGSGKSTTLAGMIDYINKNKEVNIISTEDPIEILHKDINSSISQREIGSDVASFASALKSALRQDPDVILIGEIRDLDIMRTVLVAADTGHLVITTLHTTSAAETVNRIISLYPTNERHEIRRALASSLRGIVGQKILPNTKGGRSIFNEVLLNTPAVAEIIIDETKSAKDLDKIIVTHNEIGMQSFDQALEKLFRSGTVTLDVAKEFAVDPKKFEGNLKNNIQKTSDNGTLSQHAQTQPSNITHMNPQERVDALRKSAFPPRRA